MRCRYLVGSDGGRSDVRHALGIDFPGSTLGVRAVVADVRVDGLGRDAWHRWGDGLDQIALCPLWGTELFQLQAPIPLEGEADLSAKGLNAMVAARTGRPDLTVTSVACASAYSMNARLADRYRVGRVFLAGDAAHIHPPTGGQGLNTSLQDAYNLGWKLAAVLGGAPDALLDSYEAERRPVAAEVLGLSTRLLDAAKAGIAMRRGRDTQQLDIGYPGSPLSLEGPSDHRRRGRRPRARRPGARRGRPTLAAVPPLPRSALDGAGLRSRQRAASASASGLQVHTVGARPRIVAEGWPRRAASTAWRRATWVLIRPDGYVAAVAAAGEAARRRWFRASGPDPGAAGGASAAVSRRPKRPRRTSPGAR